MKRQLIICAFFIFPASALAEDRAEIESSAIPEDLAVGIGVGWTQGIGGGNMPNTGMLRIRLPSGLSIEPSVFVSARREAVLEAWNAGLATTVRVPIARRRSVELSLLGSGAVAMDSFGEADSSYAASLSWGVGIEWFVGSAISLGADARSDVLRYHRDYDDSDTLSLGPFFAPSFRAMATLYY